MEAIILASSSPRRQEILKKLNIPFITMPSDEEETYPADIKIKEISEYLAIKKVNSVLKRVSSKQEVSWLLGADTSVILENKIYGKPKDVNEAETFLKELQGKCHEVVTGMALYNGALHEVTSRSVCAKVTMAPMSQKEIDWYLESGEWHGAAGAYRIQGLASCFIKKIEGTESCVMGLPIFELYDMLREQNYSIIE